MTANRLSVLFITPWYPHPDGPVDGIFVRAQAIAVARYADVVVLHVMGPRPNLSRPWYLSRETDAGLTAGIPTYRLVYRRFMIPRLSYLNFFRAAWAALNHLEGEGIRPDVIHAHVFDVTVPVVLWARHRGIPVLYTEHSSLVLKHDLSFGGRLKVRWSGPRCARILPVSHSMANAMKALGVKGRYQIVTNPVDTGIFYYAGPPPAPPPVRMLFVGRLHPIKGVDILLTALQHIRQKYPPWRLDIIGDGSERSRLEEFAYSWFDERHVIFHGERDQPYIADYMRKAHFLILPSHIENMPCVILEAQCCGLPVLATCVGGIPEIVDEKRGLLVAPGNPLALAEGLWFMFQRVGQWDRKRIASDARHRFSIEGIGEQLFRIYSEVRAC